MQRSHIFDSPFMRLAIEQAREAAAAGEVPIGAVVVDSQSGEVIAASGNRTIVDCDPTAHAEILAIRKACTIQQSPRIPECDLYVTLEPCPMCAQAISFARFRRLYYAASDPKGGGVEHGPRIFNSSSCHHKPEIYHGIMQEEASQLLKEFFKKKRL
ncbi:MAG: nucleoside deaminase, partial [Rectinemataceae bacterium]|nr:nucleoside deaminase [Rectinemataceae bacterium]